MLPLKYFRRFRSDPLALPLKSRYSRKELRNGRFRLFRASGLDVLYAPFHYLSEDARVVLVGLTPGWIQMERAFWAARHGMAEGLEGRALFRHVELTGSFGGPMRRNLVSMLEGTGLHRCLNISSCDCLFDIGKPKENLAHFTSSVSAPVLKKRNNYRGYGPRLLDVPELKQWVTTNLVAELTSISQALIVPLGKVANEVLQRLCADGAQRIEKNRRLFGFPHPSGQNGHRKRIFDEGQARWTRQVWRWFR